jgi:DNA repair protein RadC
MKDYEVNRTIKSLAEDDRPREKLLKKGINTLSNAELIAVIIASGSAGKNALDLSMELLQACNNSLIQLSKKTLAELQKHKGIGNAKAMTILASIELSKRNLSEKATHKTQIQSSKDAYHLIKPNLFQLNIEEFWVAYLDRANKIISLKQLSKGGLHGTVVDIRIIFKTAIDLLSSGIILFHNHPSGNLKPSINDDNITNQMRDAGKLVDILILDHLIVSNENYFSYADEGRLK